MSTFKDQQDAGRQAKLKFHPDTDIDIKYLDILSLRDKRAEGSEGKVAPDVTHATCRRRDDGRPACSTIAGSSFVRRRGGPHAIDFAPPFRARYCLPSTSFRGAATLTPPRPDPSPPADPYGRP